MGTRKSRSWFSRLSSHCLTACPMTSDKAMKVSSGSALSSMDFVRNDSTWARPPALLTVGLLRNRGDDQFYTATIAQKISKRYKHVLSDESSINVKDSYASQLADNWESNMFQNGGNECPFFRVLFLGGSHGNCCKFSHPSLRHTFHCVIRFTASYVSLRHTFHCVIRFTASDVSLRFWNPGRFWGGQHGHEVRIHVEVKEQGALNGINKLLS